MIPFDEAPFWPYVVKHHPERGEDGFRIYKAMFADIADSFTDGPGARVLHVVRDKVGGTRLTDAHYYRLNRYNKIAAECIRAEAWMNLNRVIIAVHCEGAQILEELGCD